MSDVKNYVLLVAFHPEVNKCQIGSIPEVWGEKYVLLVAFQKSKVKQMSLR